MIRSWCSIRPAARHLLRTTQIRRIADSGPFRQGDIALLRQTKDRSAPPVLTKPLKHGGRIFIHQGTIEHDQIIGKRPRDVVSTVPPRSGRRSTEYRVHEVKLDEYVTLSRRLVTPIYPADANLIVNVLELHPETPEPADESVKSDRPKLEILEAGTGHGALTLYMSRAIHGANPGLAENDWIDEHALERWRARRRAIIHTIDISSKYSEYARHVVDGFKRGIYSRNVDFNVGDVSDWVAQSLADRGGISFLSHAFLDLPAAHNHIEVVASALRIDGTLIIFNPSITQITQAATMIRENGIALELERVIELGVNGTSGGRDWDVRAVRPRAAQKLLEAEQDEVIDSNSSDDASASDGEPWTDTAPAAIDVADNASKAAGWAVICRPKVGQRIVGGGFLGVWKRRKEMNM